VVGRYDELRQHGYLAGTHEVRQPGYVVVAGKEREIRHSGYVAVAGNGKLRQPGYIVDTEEQT